MENHISAQGVITLRNKALISKTKQIFNALNETKKSTLKVARLLAEVEENEMYTQDGYESVIDYAADLFGFKNNYTYKLLKISPFINPDFTTIYDTALGGAYTAGQLIECSPLSPEQREKHINHDINSDMTTKEIREQVKIILNPVSKEKSNKEEDSGKDNAIIGKITKTTANYIKKISDLLSDINNGNFTMDNLKETGANAVVEKDNIGIIATITYEFKKEGNE